MITLLYVLFGVSAVIGSPKPRSTSNTPPATLQLWYALSSQVSTSRPVEGTGLESHSAGDQQNEGDTDRAFEEIQRQMQQTGVGSYLMEGPIEPPEPGTVTKSAGGWLLGVHVEAKHGQQAYLDSVVMREISAFSYSIDDLPGYHGPDGDFLIAPSGQAVGPPDRSTRRPPKRETQLQIEVLDDKLTPLKEAGIIKRCHNGDWVTTPIIAAKKDSVTGAWTDKRVAMDYRPINAKTPSDPYAIPFAEQIHLDIRGARYFSKIDARQGFLQIPIPQHLQHLSAFWWHGELWCYTRCPYGMKNAPAHFQRVMSGCIQRAGLHANVHAFIDDILIHSDTFEEHCEHITAVLQMLHANGLRAHPDKSIFGCSTLEFLGHDVSAWGITPSQAKVAAIRALPTPNNVDALRRVLGFAGYYRNYVPFYSEITKPLTELLQKNVVWDWTPERDRAWEAIKEDLCRPGNALKRPNPDLPYILHTDWSKFGMSAVLGQIDPEDGNEYMVACISRSNNKHEKNYGSYRGEMLAAVWGIRSYRHYLQGAKHPFVLYTDHKGLTWLMSSTNLEGQYARWACLISDYEFQIEYKPGSTHEVADTPSRDPLPTTRDSTGSREPEPSLSTYQRAAAVTVWQNVAMMTFCSDEQKSADPLIQESRQGNEPGNVGNLDSISQRVNSAAELYFDHEPLDWQTIREAGDPCALFSQFDNSHVPEDDTPGSEAESFDSILPEIPYSAWVKLRAIEQSLLASTQMHGGIDDYSLEDECEDSRHAIDLQSGSVWTSMGSALQSGGGPNLQVSGPPGTPDRVDSIDTRPTPPETLLKIQQSGISVLELFGGLMGGLTMLLRNGIKVNRYVYCDIEHDVRAIARHRLSKLSRQYPSLLPVEAWAEAFSLPQDVYQINLRHLSGLVTSPGSEDAVWCIIGGFECQDLSPAGKGRGFDGFRSTSFFPLLNIIGEMQHLLPSRPPLYFVENTAMMAIKNPTTAVQEAYEAICNSIGEPILLDAARVGSYAHRLRNYWTNLANTRDIQSNLDLIQRDPSLQLSDILDPIPGRGPQLCDRVNQPPWYRANVKGAPLKVLPTLVATHRSYAFRHGGAGLLLHSIEGNTAYSELTIEERERALGYETGATECPGASFLIRHQVTGRSFDANATSSLWAIGTHIALNNSLPTMQQLGTYSLGAETPPHLGGEVEDYEQPSSGFVQLESRDLLSCMIAATITDSEVANEDHLGKEEPWLDKFLLHLLSTGTLEGTGISVEEKARVVRRALRYEWDERGNSLVRKVKTGHKRIIPRPHDRLALIRKIHEDNGHFGRRRTTHMVMAMYWWKGMYSDIRAVLQSCKACDINKASFNAMQPTLNPLDVRGYMYRWGLDLFGPFPKSKRGHQYVLVCIEHFTKYVEAFPLVDKSSAEVAYHVLHGVLARYGSPAEMVTDGGGEFQGEVEDLLFKFLVDHRITSNNHPQANGAAERTVQTLKACLRRMVNGKGDHQDWDLYLPWVLMGYRVSAQESTRMSPYLMLFGVDPIIPPAIRERLKVDEPLSFDDPKLAAASILDRAMVMQKCSVIAGHNLHIAQHRNQLRYGKLRTGGFLPQVAHFFVGDYVYVKEATRRSNALEPLARDSILRVREVRPSGVLVLEGSCGTTCVVNALNCQKCHLPIKATEVTQIVRPTPDHHCEVCKLPNRAALMLLCDSCNRGYHTFCIGLPGVPKQEKWYCEPCLTAGVSNTTGLAPHLVAKPSPAPVEGVVPTRTSGRTRGKRLQ